MSEATDADSVEDVTPSAKLVYLALEYADGRMTQPELAEETMLPQRTVRHAIDQLLEIDAIETRPSVTDARQRQYWVDQ